MFKIKSLVLFLPMLLMVMLFQSSSGAQKPDNFLFTLLQSCKNIKATAAAYIQNITKKPTLLELLLNNPLRALQDAYKTDAACEYYVKQNINTMKDPDAMVAAFLKTVQYYEEKNPIFLLGECTQDAYGPCVLSRTYQPRCRINFAQKVSAALAQASQSGPVHYVSFAAGHLFLDLTILAHTLTQSPEAEINISVIDLQNALLVDYYDLMHIPRMLKTNEALNLNLVLEPLKKRAREMGWDGLQEDVLIRKLFGRMTFIHARHKQFISVLQNMFPQAKISLSIHDTTESFLEYSNTNNVPIPTVIATADIEDEMSLLQKSNYNYGALVVKTLQKNPNTPNLWLSKNFGKSNACIISASLENTPEAIETFFKNTDGSSIKIYNTYSEIK